MKIDLIGGARPNFMKLGPIFKEIKKHDIQPRFIYTGQHVHSAMASSIWKKVGLPDYDIQLSSNNFNNALDYIGDMTKNYNYVLMQKNNHPDAVLVVGDTDSSLIGAFVAKRNNIPVIHVEAGLKGSIDEPEQLNRSMIDSIADLMLTPTFEATERLVRKRKSGTIVYVGNVMADSIRLLLNSLQWNEIKTPPSDILVTLHRPYNVDDKSRLSEIINYLDLLSAKYQICFPVHPRTLKRINEFGLGEHDYFEQPMIYDQFIKTLSRSEILITDSGGAQAEAAYLNIPCIGLMHKSGWPNLVDAGAVTLCPDPKKMNKIVNQLIKKPKSKNVIDGLEGYAAKKICRSIIDWLNFEYKNKFA
jgi:UDP-N-acetylglucosamine 2-epimerase (non-hydrolysing)